MVYISCAESCETVKNSDSNSKLHIDIMKLLNFRDHYDSDIGREMCGRLVNLSSMIVYWYEKKFQFYPLVDCYVSTYCKHLKSEKNNQIEFVIKDRNMVIVRYNIYKIGKEWSCEDDLIGILKASFNNPVELLVPRFAYRYDHEDFCSMCSGDLVLSLSYGLPYAGRCFSSEDKLFGKFKKEYRCIYNDNKSFEKFMDYCEILASILGEIYRINGVNKIVSCDKPNFGIQKNENGLKISVFFYNWKIEYVIKKYKDGVLIQKCVISLRILGKSVCGFTSEELRCFNFINTKELVKKKYVEK